MSKANQHPADDTEQRLKSYGEFRRELVSKQAANSDNYDKSLLTLSASGLGLSLSFLKDFVPSAAATMQSFLIASWFLFSGTIILTICSFQFSQWGIKKALIDAGDYYLKRQDNALDRSNRWNDRNHWAGIFAGICFIAAILFSAFFVTLNLGHKKDAKATAPVCTCPVDAKQNQISTPANIKPIVMPQTNSQGTQSAPDTRGQPVNTPIPIVTTPAPVTPDKK